MDLQSTWIRSERCMRVDEKMLKDTRKLLKFGVNMILSYLNTS